MDAQRRGQALGDSEPLQRGQKFKQFFHQAGTGVGTMSYCSEKVSPVGKVTKLRGPYHLSLSL